MILHTIVPYELVFQYENNIESKEKTIMYNGIPVIVEAVNATEFQVKSILSTDPNHYMQLDLYPGAVLSIWP